jgi:tetratricopeptide (TPR) repeat protein
MNVASVLFRHRFRASEVTAGPSIRLLIMAAVLPLLPLLVSKPLQGQVVPEQSSCNATAAFERVTPLLAAGKYDEAANALDKIGSCGSLSAIESFQLGWLYGRARHFDAALKAFDKVPPDVPDPITHAYAVALSKFELADYRGSVGVLARLQTTSSLDAKSANLLAVSYSKLGLYQQAYAVLAVETEKNPNDLSAYLNLTAVCAEGGNYQRAAEVATQASVLFPNSPEVFIIRGAAHTFLGQLDAASADFATAEKLAPSRADVRFFLALMDYKQSKFPDAVSVLDAAQKQGIADSDLDYLMSECVLKIDATNTKVALQHLDRAIQLNPHSSAARASRGKLLLESNHVKEATTDLELALKDDPSSRSALYNLARAYKAVGKTSEADALFQQLRDAKTNAVTEMGDARLTEALVDKGQSQ